MRDARSRHDGVEAGGVFGVKHLLAVHDAGSGIEVRALREVVVVHEARHRERAFVFLGLGFGAVPLALQEAGRAADDVLADRIARAHVEGVIVEALFTRGNAAVAHHLDQVVDRPDAPFVLARVEDARNRGAAEVVARNEVHGVRGLAAHITGAVGILELPRHFPGVDDAGLEALARPARADLSDVTAVGPVFGVLGVLVALVEAAVRIDAAQEEAVAVRGEADRIREVARLEGDVGRSNAAERREAHVGVHLGVDGVGKARHGEAAQAAEGDFELVVAGEHARLGVEEDAAVREAARVGVEAALELRAGVPAVVELLVRRDHDERVIRQFALAGELEIAVIGALGLRIVKTGRDGARERHVGGGSCGAEGADRKRDCGGKDGERGRAAEFGLHEGTPFLEDFGAAILGVVVFERKRLPRNGSCGGRRRVRDVRRHA